VFTALAVALGGADAVGSDPRGEFLGEYEPHAAGLKARYTGVAARYRVLSPLGPGKEQRTLVEGKFDHDHYLLAVKENTVVELATGRAESLGGERCTEGRNNRYAFRVEDRGADGYRLLRLEQYPPGRPPELSALCFPYAVPHLNKSYLDLAKDPTSRVISWGETAWRGKAVKALRVEFTVYHRDEKRDVRAECTYYFSPAEGWVCVGSHSHPRDPARAAGYTENIFAYDSAGEWAVPRRSELWYKENGSTDPERVRVTEIESFVPVGKLNEADFRLTAFGMPEPEGVVWEKPFPRYWYFVGAAALFGILALLIRYFGRRTATAPPATA
jgi:hypothetical protein